jgi:hypothetical protein
MTIKKCRDCGLEKLTSEYWKQNKKGHLQSYCKPCSAARAKKFQVKKSDITLPKLICDVCLIQFQPKKKWQKRCSAKCGYTFQNKKIANPRLDGNCARCNKSLAGKRKDAIYCSKSCGSMDHNFKHRSHTRITGVARRLEILNRDQAICYICNKKITDKFEIDHLIPVSKDGSNDASNLAATHPTCNKKRGSRIGEQQLSKLAELSKN